MAKQIRLQCWCGDFIDVDKRFTAWMRFKCGHCDSTYLYANDEEVVNHNDHVKRRQHPRLAPNAIAKIKFNITTRMEPLPEYKLLPKSR